MTSSDGSRERSYEVQVEAPNEAPVALAIPALELTAGAEPASIVLAEFFSDAEADPLQYTLAELEPVGVASVTLADGVVTVTPVSAGTATFSLAASDGELTSEAISVTLTVTMPEAVEAVEAVEDPQPEEAVEDPQAADTSTDFRIAARRLADSRVEFALQVRGSDAAWGERLLPGVRYLPADAEANRWLVSGAVSVDDAPSELQVRIAARRLTDGRVEFALQVRGSDAAWGERLLPETRYLPADAEAGRWLVSSPLTTGLAPAGG